MLKHTPPLNLDRRRARSTASKNKIAEAAEKIVLTLGRNALTAHALAEQAGVSERTVFNHFKKLDDALTYQLSVHLEPCIDEPPFPKGLEVSQIPQAIVEHFHEAVESDRAKRTLVQFIILAASLSDTGECDEGFELVAKEVILTLSHICDAFCTELDQTYPQLSAQQSVSLGLFVFNLLMGIIFGFLRFAETLDEIIYTDQPHIEVEAEMFLPFIHQNIDQVATGLPVFDS